MKNGHVSRFAYTLLALTPALASAACATADGITATGAGGAGGAGGEATTASSSDAAVSTGFGDSTTSSTSDTTSTATGGSSATPGLIDDMEDKDGAILTAEGRKGSWYTYNDGTGMQTPAAKTAFSMSPVPVPRDGSLYAAHTSGSAFTVWGSGMGLDLVSAGGTKSAYDASGYTGISFWALVGVGGDPAVRVSLADKDTAPEGGVCDDAGGKCNDHFGVSLQLGPDWKQYTLAFSDLKQVGFGQAFPSFTPAALYAITFQSPVKATFEVWIDDISFTQ